MFVVRFSTLKTIEHTHAAAFEQRVGRWLLLREAENSYILGEIPKLLATARASSGTRISERMFTVEDGDHIVAVALLLKGGCLCMTWATDEIVDVLAEYLTGSRCNISSTFAPGHVSWRLAQKWSELNQMTFEFGRSERVYQIARVDFNLPESGKLTRATDADVPFLAEWVRAFMVETAFEMSADTSDRLLAALLKERALFVWRNPGPASMAAWVAPTPNGGAINFVYTPTALRGKGFAKCVVSALARQQLAAGKKYCFILTDTQDVLTNRLYQSIGARTLCELLRCTLHAKAQLPLQAAPAIQTLGKLNVM